MGVFAALWLMAAARGECRVLPAWRDKLASRWAESPASLDASDAAWKAAKELEEPGLSFRALNDRDNLYLQLTSINRDGRALLTGAFRQDFTIWFLGQDRKSRAWGLRLVFSSFETPPGVSWEDVHHPDEVPPQLSAAPEMVSAAGVFVSSAPLPPEIGFKSELTGREPVYAFRIPINKLTARKARHIPFEFVSSRASPEVERQFAARRAQEPSPSAWQRPAGANAKKKIWITATGDSYDPAFPERTIRRNHPPAEPSLPRELLLPDPLSLRLSVQLAAESMAAGQPKK